jgi:peptidyl-prolyl cis-trans isomerase C
MKVKYVCLLALAAQLALGVPRIAAQNIAVVNGKPIPTSRADVLIKTRMVSPSQSDGPELRARAREQLITAELLTQAAEKRGFANSPALESFIADARQHYLITTLMDDFLEKHPVTPSELAAEYSLLQQELAGRKEYHVSHIMFGNQDDAKATIVKLKAGERFEELAKQSKDTRSIAAGGDLGWREIEDLPKSFVDAMVAMQPGQLTEAPVENESGDFHVIKLHEVRAARMPTREEVGDQFLRARVQQRKQEALVEELRKNADIR